MYLSNDLSASKNFIFSSIAYWFSNPRFLRSSRSRIISSRTRFLSFILACRIIFYMIPFILSYPPHSLIVNRLVCYGVIGVWRALALSRLSKL